MNRTRIKSHFQYGWWIYLLIVAAVVTLWCSIFYELSKPATNEILTITIVGNVEDTTLADDLKKALDGKTSAELKKINVEVVSGTTLNIGEIVAMRCMGDTDIIIFDEDYIVTPVALNFKAIDESALVNRFGNVELYKEEDSTYGFLLYDGTTKTNFANYYNGEKKFWAFITPVSENASAINGKGKKEDDTALQALEYLMEAV